MAVIYISIGSNIDRDRYLRQGIRALSAAFGPLTISSVYESHPVGFDGSDFYNLVVGAHTDMSVVEVAGVLRQIELDNGRVREAVKFSSRTLDLDLLVYDALIIDDGVQLPRREIVQNAFVLRPLAEIAAEVRHPVLHQSYQRLWQEYDKAQQALWIVPFDWQGADG